MFRICYFLLACLLAVACSDTAVVEVYDDAGVLTERYTVRKADSVRHGPAEAFDVDGVLMEEAEFVDGALEGTRKRYYPDGTLQAEETLRAGQLHGPYRSYYPDGTLETESEYVEHDIEGTLTGYYRDGARKEEVTMAGSRAVGPFREWHPNGALKAEGQYVRDGKEDGELLLYDEAGELERKMDCEVGVCRTTWPPELVKATADEI